MKQVLSAFRRRIQQLQHTPLESLGRPARMLRYGLDLLHYAAVDLKRKNAAESAAALTYRTLFGLVPLTVCVLLVFNAFGGFDQLGSDLRTKALSFLNLDTLTTAGTPSPEPPETPAETQPATQPDDLAATQPGGLDVTRATQIAEDPSAALTQAASDPAEAERPEAEPAVSTDLPLPDPDAPGPHSPTSADPQDESTEEQDELDPEAQAAQDAALREQAEAEANARMQEQLEGLLSELGQRIAKVSFASIGVVGIAVLIWGTISLLVTVERSFNRVFGAVGGRPWSLRVPIYWAVVTLGPLLLATGVVMLNRTAEPDALPPVLAGVVKLVRPLSSIATSWLLLIVMYTLVPAARVRLRPALFGALVAAVAWEASKSLFGAYVKTVGTSAVYGALGLVPLGMLWIYLTWLIVLFGLIVTHAVQTLPAERLRREADRADEAVLGYDRSWLLLAAAAAAEAFDQGGAIDSETWAEQAATPESLADRVLADLAQAGVLRGIERPDQSTAYVPARPPSAITVSSILAMASDTLALERGQRPPAASDALARAETAAARALDGMTLADLLASSTDHAAPKGSEGEEQGEEDSGDHAVANPDDATAST
ncbi:MAG: YhjD/YihY/BrkB family envelope integrity protein [Planctomycetota bacterium]